MMMNRTRSAKRQKLDTAEDEKKEKSRLPDDVLFKIFSLLSIRDRMRLSLVSKRFRQLIHFDPKRTVWKDIDTLTLSLTLEGMSLINGHIFSTRTRANALRLFLDCCAPFKQVEISANLDTTVDLPWLENIFLRYLLEAQNHAGKGPPPELIFSGNLRYAPAVFERLVGEQTAKISVEIGSDKPKDWHKLWRTANLKNVWSKISACNSLTEFHFGCTDIELFGLGAEQTVAALSGKESLRKLSFKIADGQEPELFPQFIRTVASIANSCPSLLTLVCSGQRWSGLGLIDLLAPATRERLQELTICGEPDEDWEVEPQMRNILANQFTDLTKLTINLENAAPFIEIFLSELEDKILYMDLNLSCDTWGSENQCIVLLEELKSVCDGVAMAMAPEGRFAFVNGAAAVACRFVQEKWPDENLK